MTLVEEIVQDLKTDGFAIRKMFADKAITKKIRDALDDVSSLYSESMVQNKIFRPRENHPARKGDACMVASGKSMYAPYLTLKDHELRSMFEFYKVVVSNALDIELGDDTKLLMNWQEYREGDNSLPYHADVELFEGDWGKYSITIDEGLLPRFVMVVVTENENNGSGLCIMANGEEVELNLEEGDMVIFDNNAVLHGVPKSTPKPRKMIGFRSVDANPLYFSKEDFPGAIAYENGHIKGFCKELTRDEAIGKLLEHGWYF